MCVRERERERERGRVGYNEAAGKKFVITGATDITNSGYNESLLNVPGDLLYATSTVLYELGGPKRRGPIATGEGGGGG